MKVSVALFLSALLVVTRVTAQADAKWFPHTAAINDANNAEPRDKRVEEGSVGVETNAKSSQKLEERLVDLLTPVEKMLKPIADIKTGKSHFDWRDRGAVTPVQDQGQCDSGWAFAAAGSVESIYIIKYGYFVELSAQQLLDCSRDNNSCDGGSVDSAFQYIIATGGIDSERDYPYDETVGKCRYNPSDKAAQIKSYKNVKPRGSEVALLKAVKKQPVAVVVDDSQDSFYNYKSGVYYEPRCSQTNVNHAMLVVGYGTNGKGKDYWIVKNSYGVAWGEQGYILMARNRDNNCGIASNASFPIF